MKDKFNIKFDKTSVAPKGQKTEKYYSASGEVTIHKSPDGELIVGVNADDFTGEEPKYGGFLKGRIRFKEGGFVSA